MAEFRFSVFSQLVGIAGSQGSWSAFLRGADGKRRPAEFVVPGFLAEEELGKYLADLFHELATPTNRELFRIG